MNITRTSNISGVTRTLDLDVTDAQMAAFMSGELAQRAFPHLPAHEREFIMTGATQEEWDALFPPEEQ